MTDVLRAHAEQEFPRESCGVVIIQHGRERYWPCRNISDVDTQFSAAPEDLAAAEDAGDIVGVVHSHPNRSVCASDADLVG